MDYLDFFRLQAKNLYRDWKTHTETEDGIYEYKPRFFDVDDFLLYFDEDQNEKNFCLQRAQHMVAKVAGFDKWNDLIKADEQHLELARIVFNGCTHSGSIGNSCENWESFYSDGIFLLPIENQVEMAKYYFSKVDPPNKQWFETIDS